MIFFIIAFAIYSLINFYVIRKFWKAIISVIPAFAGMTIKILLVSLFLFLFLSFPVAMLFRYELPIPFLKFLYLPGTFWLGAIMYLLLFFGVMDIVFLVIGYRRTLFPAFAGMTGVIILLFYGYCNFSHPVVVEREISFCHPREGGNDRIRAVAISDLHLGLNIDRKKLSEYIDLINAQKPDIVLIAGDVVDNCVRPLNEERMYEEFDRIDAPLGVYMCLGNHEYLSGIDESLDFLRKTKIHLLIDDKVLIDSCFYIVGRDDAKMGKKRKSLSELVEGIDRNFPVIVLDHQPLNLEEAEENGIDLQISGHTHNGQLFPGNLIAKAIYELSHGYMKKGKTNHIVSSGLGLWGPMLRIGTQSEIVVVDLTSDTQRVIANPLN